MANSLTLAAKLSLDAQRWNHGLNKAAGGMKGFVAGAKKEMASLKSAFNSVQGQLASLGATVGATALIMQSAQMDKGLIKIKQTAGLTTEEMKKLRVELFDMSKASGQNVDDLQVGFAQLAAGGLKFQQALPTIKAINMSMAVTGSTAETLSGALLSAQEHFGFDLSKPEVAANLLDKMTVAGRAGVIEIEDLSGAFASAAANASKAGLNIDQTLALFEGLGTATTKDRLGNLVDSTLRVFTNKNYMDAAEKASGVKFFEGGKRRDPLVVLADIKKKYDTLKSEESKMKFLDSALGKADLDTQKGIYAAFKDGKLDKILSIAKESAESAGTTARDFPEAIANAADQAGRLKSTLREAADGFARPINDAIASTTESLFNKNAEGKTEFDGKQAALLTGGVVGLGYLAKRYGGKVGQALLGKFGGTAVGLGEGAAIEAATGVPSVFVVNMPSAGIGGAIPGAAAAGGVPGKVGAAVNVVAAGAVGYAVGTAAYDNVLTEQGPAGTKFGQAAGETIGLYFTRQFAPYSKDAASSLKTNGTDVGAVRQYIAKLFPKIGLLDAFFSNASANNTQKDKMEAVIKLDITGNAVAVKANSTNNPRHKTIVQTNLGQIMNKGMR